MSAGSDDRMHALLPRYLLGRLGEDETVTFRRHLEGCDECREEKEFLEKVQRQVERHGGELFSDHPGPERLVALHEGELAGEEAATLRRHLELCATCALEMRWVSGQAVVTAAPPRRRRRSRVVWSWPGALAATIVLGVALHFALMPGAPRASLLTPHAIGDVTRADGGNTVYVSESQRRVVIFVPIDLAPSEFPCTLAILDAEGEPIAIDDASGTPVWEVTLDSPASLVAGLHQFVDCPRNVCRPGSYTVRIQPSTDGPPRELPFTVVER